MRPSTYTTLSSRWRTREARPFEQRGSLETGSASRSRSRQPFGGPRADLLAVKETAESRSATMRAVRSTNTGPEWTVRRLVHSLGYRYRLHRKDLPGTPDLVFPGRRKVIFVHGCFWHGHSCRRGSRTPKTNTDYWQKKIGRNRERDLEHAEALRELGWQLLVVWECDLGKASRDTLVDRVQTFLESA